MSAQVGIIHPGGVVSRNQQQQLIAMERAILDAIAQAKEVGVPQGLIVAVLHGQSSIQTSLMIGTGTDQ